MQQSRFTMQKDSVDLEKTFANSNRAHSSYTSYDHFLLGLPWIGTSSDITMNKGGSEKAITCV